MQRLDIRSYCACFFAAVLLVSCTDRNSAKLTTDKKETPSVFIPAGKTDSTLPDDRNPNNLTALYKASADAVADTLDSTEDFLQKATVSKHDSLVWLRADMKRDHKIVGYHQPDTLSTKMLVLSIFTSDVENNPFKCPLGAYYDTGGMRDMSLKYLSAEDNFIKVAVSKNNKRQDIIYILKKWIVFE